MVSCPRASVTPKSRLGLAIETVTSGSGALPSSNVTTVTDWFWAKTLLCGTIAIESTATAPTTILTKICFVKSIVRSKFIFKLWKFIPEMEDNLPVPFAINTEIQSHIRHDQLVIETKPGIAEIHVGKVA